MNTLTKLALGLMGHMKPREIQITPLDTLTLPPPDTHGGLPLMKALQLRQSTRVFEPTELSSQMLSNLLWAAAGINRPELGGRTAPSAMNAQEVDVFVALPKGLYHYDPKQHALQLTKATDVRRVTGYQDFVDHAPLDLIFVTDHSSMQLVPVAQRESYAAIAVGAMAQNVYLYCASSGLACVIRAWIDRNALSNAMGLTNDQQVLMAQTVGLCPNRQLPGQ